MAVRVKFSDPNKNVGKTSVLYIFKMVSFLTFLEIVLLMVPIMVKILPLEILHHWKVGKIYCNLDKQIG
jgi:hypothetical protein